MKLILLSIGDQSTRKITKFAHILWADVFGWLAVEKQFWASGDVKRNVLWAFLKIVCRPMTFFRSAIFNRYAPS